MSTGRRRVGTRYCLPVTVRAKGLPSLEMLMCPVGEGAAHSGQFTEGVPISRRLYDGSVCNEPSPKQETASYQYYPSKRPSKL